MGTSAVSREDALDLYTRMIQAWNGRDAAGFAAVFTDPCTCIGFDGSQMESPAAIARDLGAIFRDHPTATYVARVVEIRLPAAGAALLRADVGMVPPGGTELNPAVHAIQTVLAVSTPDGPRLTLLQNTPAAFHGRPQLRERMTDELTAVLRAGRVVEVASRTAADGSR